MTSSSAEYGASLLRISLGILALSHGLLKVFGFTIPGTVQFFGSLGYPPIAAYMVIIGELAGGAALLLGVYTRTVALAMIPILLGATYTHIGNGWVFSAPNGGWEFPAFWTVMLLVQALLGSGKFAVSLPELLQFNGLKSIHA